MDINEITTCLNTKHTVADYKRFVKKNTWKIITDVQLATMFSCKKTVDEVINHIFIIKEVSKIKATRNRNVTKTRLRVKVKDFVKRCEENNIGLEKLIKHQVIEKQLEPDEIVDIAVSKNKKVIDFMCVNSTRLKEELKALNLGHTIDSHSLLNDYEELLAIFMSKARGEIPTKRISRTMNCELNEEGEIVGVKIAIGSNGKAKYHESTETNLPSEQALATTFILAEVIETLKGKSSEFLTDEELEAEYTKLLTKASDDETKGKERSIVKDSAEQEDESDTMEAELVEDEEVEI